MSAAAWLLLALLAAGEESRGGSGHGPDRARDGPRDDERLAVSTEKPQAAGDEDFLRSEELGELIPSPTWRAEATVVGHHFFAAGLDEGPGELAIGQADVRLDLSRRLDEKRSLGFRLRHETSFFDFQDGAAIGGLVDPFDELHLASLGATLVTRGSNDFSWLVTVYAALGYQSGAELSDGLTFGGGSTLTFRISSKLLLTVGAFGNTRLEDDPLVYPWLQLDWQPTERLHVGREGSGVGVGYSWLEHLSAYANVSFVERNYRLADDAPASIASGVVRDDEFALNAGLAWKPEGPWTVELYGGVALRELSLLEDDAGVADATVDATPYAALRVGYAF